MPTDNKHLISIEGARGFAALLVTFVHFHGLFFSAGHGLCLAVSRFMATIGHSGVDIFFLISGFLLYRKMISAQKPLVLGQYLLARVKRIYPTFVAVLAIYVALSFFCPRLSKFPGNNPWENFVYLMANLAMLPGIFEIKPIITVAWTLSYEWCFYLLLPLFVCGLSMRRWIWQYRVEFWLILSGVQCAMVSAGVSKHPRLIMFVAGIVLCEFSRQLISSKKSLCIYSEWMAILAFLAVLSGIGFGVLKNEATAMTPSLFVSCFLLMMHALFFKGKVNKLFSSNWLRSVGKISYSFFLTHGLTLHGFKILMSHVSGVDAQSSPILIFIVGMTASLLVARFTYFLVEERFSTKKIVV